MFATLGLSRDSDVLDGGVVAELSKVGAPPLALPAGAAGPDPLEAVRATETQQTFLAWIAWRAALTQSADAEADPIVVEPHDEETRRPSEAVPTEADLPEGGAHAEGGKPLESEVGRRPRDAARTFHRNAERRLRRWHRRIVADWNAFDELDDASLHALRKHIKRQRYAVEFFAPVLRRRETKRYLTALAAIQDRMGELNDLFVARARYQAVVASDPAAWFALGWLAARIAAVRGLAKSELGQLAKAKPPTS